MNGRQVLAARTRRSTALLTPNVFRQRLAPVMISQHCWRKPPSQHPRRVRRRLSPTLPNPSIRLKNARSRSCKAARTPVKTESARSRNLNKCCQKTAWNPAQLDGANMQCDDSALSAPVDTPQVPLLLKAADSTSPLHPSYSSLAVSELQHKDDKPNKMAAIPEHRASPPALRIKTSLPSTPKKEDEKEAFSSPLTPSDDEEIPAVLAHHLLLSLL